MDFLRLMFLLALLLYGAAAIERAHLVISAKQKTCAVATNTLTHEDKIYIRHVAGLASVQAASIVVQDGILPGTGLDRAAEIFDPTAHAETEAIRDACRGVKTSVLKNGILYTSRKPCTMCMGIIARAGISRVCFAPLPATAVPFSLNRGQKDKEVQQKHCKEYIIKSILPTGCDNREGNIFADDSHM